MFIHGNAQWSENEEQTWKIWPPKFWGFNKFLPRLIQEKQSTFISIANTITNAWVKNIPPQEVRFNIIQCQIRGNFTSSALIHQCVESSEYTFFFCRKLFSLFFLPLYRVIKKVKARCVKQKSEGHGPASAGVLIPLILDQKKVQPAAPTRSLSQASYTGGRGRGGGGGGGGGGWVGGFWGCQRCLLPLLLPSDPPPWVCQNTPLWHLGWQTQLLSFEYWNKTDGLMFNTAPRNHAYCFIKTNICISLHAGFTCCSKHLKWVSGF